MQESQLDLGESRSFSVLPPGLLLTPPEAQPSSRIPTKGRADQAGAPSKLSTLKHSKMKKDPNSVTSTSTKKLEKQEN